MHDSQDEQTEGGAKTFSDHTQDQTKQPFVVTKRVLYEATNKIPLVSLELANQ